MGFLVTKEQVKQWSACADGYRWFLEAFPQGGEYTSVQAALRAANRLADAGWLTEKMFSAAMLSPALTTEIAADHKMAAGELIAATSGVLAVDAKDCGSSGDDAQIGSSGNYARIGSSGNDARIGSSGNYARIGSSGYGARIGSSGYGARIGSSGYGARIGSSGNGAQIGSSGNYARIGSSGYDARINAEGESPVIACAGTGTKFKSSIGGAVAVAYHDGKRTRFAVGYVEDGGLKPGIWYSVSESGEFVEVPA